MHSNLLAALALILTVLVSPIGTPAASADDGPHFHAEIGKWTPSFIRSKCKLQVKIGQVDATGAAKVKLRVFDATAKACQRARGFDSEPVAKNMSLYTDQVWSVGATKIVSKKHRKNSCGHYTEYTTTFKSLIPDVAWQVTALNATIGSSKNGYMFVLDPASSKKLPGQKKCR